MEATPEKSESLRERKRRETRDRLVETGLRLFMENGYEATTIDTLAAAAGVSRRNFFRYFNSKDEVLLAWQGAGVAQALKPAMLKESPDQAPLDAAHRCLLMLASRYETGESIVIDRLLRSTEALRIRKDAAFVDMERSLLEAMTEIWPSPARLAELRIVSMTAIGLLRLSLEQWRETNAAHPLAYYLRRNFKTLAKQFR